MDRQRTGIIKKIIATHFQINAVSYFTNNINKPPYIMKNKSGLAITIIGLLFFISAASVSAQKKAEPLKYGKYGCTASKYNGGSVQYLPRGSFVITKAGTYTYSGFEKPSSGKYTVDAKGNLLFKGGYFDGGKAEKIDRPHKFFLVVPANPDNRWTAGYVEE
jgi:hypothetical protein